MIRPFCAPSQHLFFAGFPGIPGPARRNFAAAETNARPRSKTAYGRRAGDRPYPYEAPRTDANHYRATCFALTTSAPVGFFLPWHGGCYSTSSEEVVMKILVAYDGSPASEAAIDLILGRPWPEGSQVCVVTVIEPPMFYPMASGIEVYPPLSEKALQA